MIGFVRYYFRKKNSLRLHLEICFTSGMWLRRMNLKPSLMLALVKIFKILIAPITVVGSERGEVRR